jgi:hypothetical protein
MLMGDEFILLGGSVVAVGNLIAIEVDSSVFDEGATVRFPDFACVDELTVCW